MGDKSLVHPLTGHPKLGTIAGNGRFPFLVLDAARGQGYEVVVAAIKEETSPEIESRGATVHWLSHSEASPLRLPACLLRPSIAASFRAGWNEQNAPTMRIS